MPSLPRELGSMRGGEAPGHAQRHVANVVVTVEQEAAQHVDGERAQACSSAGGQRVGPSGVLLLT